MRAAPVGANYDENESSASGRKKLEGDGRESWNDEDDAR